VNPSTTGERCFAVLMMLIGVFTFSFASGSLSSIMHNVDSQQAEVNEKLLLLDSLTKYYNFSPQLYDDLKNIISYDNHQKEEDLDELLKELPHKVKLQVLNEVHRDLDTTFVIFK